MLIIDVKTKDLFRTEGNDWQLILNSLQNHIKLSEAHHEYSGMKKGNTDE